MVSAGEGPPFFVLAKDGERNKKQIGGNRYT